MAGTLSDKTDYGNKPGDGPLAPGGQQRSGYSRDKNLPSTPSKAVERQQHSLEVVRDLSGGTEVVRACGRKYLPQEPGESNQNYAIRLERSVFFNVFTKTVEGLTGFVFSKDPVLGEDVPPVIAEHWENMNNAGTHGDVFVRDLLQDDLIAGHDAMFVEFPRTGGEQFKSQEIGTNPIRPYWVPIKKDNIVSWRTTVENGRTVLTQLVLKECATVADGAFGEKDVEQYRVFIRDETGVRFVLLRETDDKTVVIVDEGPYPTQDEIPVAEIISSGRISLFESRPPLLDLAYLNIAHYQQYSDYRNSMHKTCVPILTLIGSETGYNDDGSPKPTVVVGPNTVLTLPPGAAAQYTSHDGAALGSVKGALDDLKADMATLGLAMLAPQKRAAETAEAKRIDKGAADSALAVTARGLQDGIERALYFHAKYLNMESGGSVKINRDFENAQADAATLVAVGQFAEAIGMPIDVVLEELQARGWFVGQDVDQLAIEIMSNKAAKEAQRAAELAAMQDQQTEANNAAKGVAA